MKMLLQKLLGAALLLTGIARAQAPDEIALYAARPLTGWQWLVTD